ncbi:MAG: chemotaxis-specific protein-glutamate methyltransferase CheB [Acidobacteriota bacterium]
MRRVLIVDDSAFNRVTLERALRDVPGIQVVGTAVDGYDAIRQIRRWQPHVMTLDLEMPRMDGLSLIRWVMQRHPLPILVVTSRESNYSLFEALELGALDFVLKPGRVSPDLASIRQDLITKIHQVVDIPMHARRYRPGDHRTAADTPPAPAVCLEPLAAGHVPRVIAMVASTGGPAALQVILRALPGTFPIPIIVVQHMPSHFTQAFARRLDETASLKVVEARKGEQVLPGMVLIAPGGSHMMLVEGSQRSLWIALRPGLETDPYIPSGDRLLASVAAVCGDAGAGVILTGMGQDGCQGLKRLREAGGLTMAESEESAVVYGMPRHALAAGAVQEIMPLEQIVAQIKLMGQAAASAALGGPATQATDRFAAQERRENA